MNKLYNKKYFIMALIFIISIYNEYFNNYYHHHLFPKISVFLPIYNMQKYIKNAINSLQKQTYKNIEIIAVNDFSTDKTYDILKELSLKDKRIKIINNTKNYGLLYSRAMGIIHSSGEYLMNLDPDDVLDDSNNLEYLYKKITKYKADIISFGLLLKSNMKIKNLCNTFYTKIEQPKLFEEVYDELVIKDYFIVNKLMKREIFLKAYNLFEKYIYSNKWNYHEDNIWSFLVHKVASSKICVRKIIYVYNDNLNKASLMSNRGTLLEYKNIIYRFEMKKIILNNKNHYEYISRECNFLIYSINISDTFKINIKSNIDLQKRTVYNLKNCILKYNISEDNKKFVIDLINDLNYSYQRS